MTTLEEQKYFDDSFIVGYLFNALESISKLLDDKEHNKASIKVYESMRFIKENARKNAPSQDKEIPLDENTINL
jgi:hypothetical protein